MNLHGWKITHGMRNHAWRFIHHGGSRIVHPMGFWWEAPIGYQVRLLSKYINDLIRPYAVMYSIAVRNRLHTAVLHGHLMTLPRMARLRGTTDRFVHGVLFVFVASSFGWFGQVTLPPPPHARPQSDLHADLWPGDPHPPRTWPRTNPMNRILRKLLQYLPGYLSTLGY
jgi:hypothetical protein